MFLVICIVENKQGQKTQTIDRKETEKKARVFYHQKCTAYNNADDVKQATILIMTETGVVLPNFIETVLNEETEAEAEE